MDKSPEYITMCDWPEIQGRWKPADGDYYVIDGMVPRTYCTHCLECKTEMEERRYDAIWLPLQWQSQEMVKPVPDFPFNQVGNLIRWIDAYKLYSCGFKTMQQLWLAFVMHELHRKKWTGEKWKGE